MRDQASVRNSDAVDQVERTFERIIGNSAALESVLDQVERLLLRIQLSWSREKRAQEKNSSHTPFTMQVSAAGALSLS